LKKNIQKHFCTASVYALRNFATQFAFSGFHDTYGQFHQHFMSRFCAKKL
jgi:hypothetical protein